VAIRRLITKFMSSNIILRSMAKVAIKYENTVPPGEIFTWWRKLSAHRTGQVKTDRVILTWSLNRTKSSA